MSTRRILKTLVLTSLISLCVSVSVGAVWLEKADLLFFYYPLHIGPISSVIVGIVALFFIWFHLLMYRKQRKTVKAWNKFIEIYSAHRKSSEFVRQAKQIVESSIDDPHFRVSDLCKALNSSHSQVHRKLKGELGLSATQFIRRIRIEKAKKLLSIPDRTIISVALDTGFQDPNYFGRIFKQEVGMTPTEWKKRSIKIK